MYRSSLAKVSRLLIVLALTIGELATGVFVTPVQPALGAVTQVFLPNITKTLGGRMAGPHRSSFRTPGSSRRTSR